jgi:hypothetical protein
MGSRRCRLAWLACLFIVASRAPAQTDEIQVYDAEIAAPGTFNLTWHDNYTPSGRSQPAFAGGLVPDHALNGVPEWAYGITDWFEAGAYVPIYTRTAGGALLFDAVKLRALLVAPDARQRTFFYGLNFELSYNTAHWDPSRYSGEMRPIIGWHLGRWDLIVNPILDTEFNGLGQLAFAPAMRAAFRVNHEVQLALEEYADFGPLERLRSGGAQTVFAVLDYRTGANGIELGIGRGLNAASDATLLKLILMHDL